MTTTIINKLINIQSGLKAPKDAFNDFGKYKYRSAESILEAVKPLLTFNEVILTLNDELVNIGDRYYIKATATIKDNTGEVQVSAYAREEESKKGMDGSQVTGASSSYARKYALNGLFAIDDTKDSDVTNTQTKEEHPATQLLTDKQVTRLYSIAASKGYSKQDVLKSVAGRGFKEPKELPKAIYDEICNTLQELPDKK